MIVLTPLTLHALTILAGLSHGCPNLAQPQVEVTINASEPSYDTSMTHEELTTGFANNPDSTLSTEPGWHLGGLTLSNVQNLFSASYETVTFPDGSACIQMSQVSVDIVYTPVIYIASDFAGNECRNTVTVAHEQRHVGTDLEVFNDFSPYFRKNILGYVSGLGPYGPFPAEQMQQAQDMLLNQVEQASEPLMDQLVATRRERQAVFDTQTNYERENALCPGE